MLINLITTNRDLVRTLYIHSPYTLLDTLQRCRSTTFSPSLHCCACLHPFHPLKLYSCEIQSSSDIHYFTVSSFKQAIIYHKCSERMRKSTMYIIMQNKSAMWQIQRLRLPAVTKLLHSYYTILPHCHTQSDVRLYISRPASHACHMRREK